MLGKCEIRNSMWTRTKENESSYWLCFLIVFTPRYAGVYKHRSVERRSCITEKLPHKQCFLYFMKVTFTLHLNLDLRWNAIFTKTYSKIWLCWTHAHTHTHKWPTEHLAGPTHIKALWLNTTHTVPSSIRYQKCANSTHRGVSYYWSYYNALANKSNAHIL